jgi:CDP-diacylglycerol--glycerol-3-phosphate 3-phosphatidyltransferase
VSGAARAREEALLFGPSALATPANALSLARLLAAPVLAALVVVVGPSGWGLAALWVVAAGSDGLDGYLARRHGPTRSGAFLDPLADKFLVLGALGALVAARELAVLPVALIGAREVAMSAFRAWAGRRGVSVPARPAAKLKTLLQDLVVLLALVPGVGTRHELLLGALLWVAVAATLLSGAEYLVEARRLVGRRAAAAGGGDLPGQRAA